MYNQNDARATLRQVWSTQLITCKKCRAMYIEYTGRRIGGKLGEHLRSVEGHHQQLLFHLHVNFFLPLVEHQVFNLPDHKKREEEIGLIFAQPFYRVE